MESPPNFGADQARSDEIPDAFFDALDSEDETVGLAKFQGLLAAGFSPRAFKAEPGFGSLLYWAATKNRIMIAQALVSAGVSADDDQAQIRCTDGPTGGSSSLHAAGENGNAEMIRLILGAGGRPLINTFDYISRTPLHCAIEASSKPAVQCLIQAGADVNATDEEQIGDPPIRRAVETGGFEIVKVLLDAGADPRRPGWMQLTAIHKAELREEQGRPILDLFREHLKLPDTEWKALLLPKPRSK